MPETLYRGWVKLADWLSAEDMAETVTGPTSQIQILRVGEWDHPLYGKLSVTEETLDQMVENFTMGIPGIDLAVDQSHRPEDGAAGWYTSLVRKGSELWATVRWTPMGQQLIRDGIYRYFSPEFDITYKDHETGDTYANVLRGGGLTNRPFVKGMAPVMLSDGRTLYAKEPVKAEPKGDTTVKIKLTESVRSRLQLSEEVEAEALLTAIDNALVEADKAKQSNVTLTEQNTQLNKDNSELGARVTALEAGLKLSDWVNYSASQISAGRLTPALAEQFKSVYLSDPDTAKKIIEALPITLNLTEIGTSTDDKTKTGGTSNDPDTKYLAEIDKYKDTHKVSFSDAMVMVARDNPALVKEYNEFVAGK